MDMSDYDLLALMPCPLKVPFDKKLGMYLKEKRDQGVFLKCNVDANVNNHEALPNKEVFKSLLAAQTIDQLPGITFTTGLNSLFYADFVERFIGKGYFEDVLDEKECKYSEYNYRDPKGEYTMFTINPLVMVCNLTAGLPAPESWEDLTKKEYKNSVVIRGNDSMYCETVLLTLYKDHGPGSMEKFSGNLRKGLHPAEMIKELNTNPSQSAAVYVMPYFFAKKLKAKHIQVIWPEEGALANPVSMLVKKDAPQRVKELAKYIAGKDMGQLFTDALFPVLNNQVDNREFDNKKLKWIGWDLIHSKNLGQTVKTLNSYFLARGSLENLTSLDR